ncbi:MAG: hypothetical protein ACRELS_03465 [Candidatus Rokuibacteriota bacterium]
MTLKEQLDDLREKSRARVPREAQDVMHRAVEELRRSGFVGRALKVGDMAPDFTLPTDDGRMVGLTGALDRGPVVLSFFRGRW